MEKPRSLLDDLLDAYQELQEAHIMLEGTPESSPQYSEYLDRAVQATREYYRVLERLKRYTSYNPGGGGTSA